MAPKKAAKKGEKPAGGKKTKKEGPKRPLSAYMYFGQERRKSLIEEKPELKAAVTEISKILGAEWKEMTDSQKTKFNKLAAEDKARYEKEKAKEKAKAWGCIQNFAV